MERTKNTPPHIAILQSPGMGHLIPLVEFAKQLVLRHGFSVTFLVPTVGTPPEAQRAFLEGLPEKMNCTLLPPISFDDQPEDITAEARIHLTMTRSLPSIRRVFESLTATTCLVAFVVDLFGTDAIDVAKEFNVSPYIYFLSTAMALSLLFYLPKLDQMVSCEYRDLPEPVKIPGCIPVHGRDLVEPIQDRKSEAYKWILHHAKRCGLAKGIMVNSFIDLEPGAIKSLLEEEPAGKPPVYPIGPLIQTRSTTRTDGSECLSWLDHQPSRSVLFVSFGSGGTLTHHQLTELAMGLEMSQQRFLWVARSPDRSSNASYFTAQSQSDPLGFLPEGFLDRTRGRGLVVPSWAPQIGVLSHGSTGGFLTHCGWNSILESIVHGVPFIAWPLFAEQKMNSIMLTEDLRVALRPNAEENGLVGREEIAKVVKDLMVGEEANGTIRKRIKELKDSAAKALSKDGDSTKALCELADKWKKNQKSI